MMQQLGRENYASVAQLVELLICNQWVGGPIPLSDPKKTKEI